MLDCLALFEKRLLFADIETFYFLSRMTLVKDEKFYDRFDQAFDAYFSGTDHVEDLFRFPETEQLLSEFLIRYLPSLDATERQKLMEEYLAAAKVGRITDDNIALSDDNKVRIAGDNHLGNDANLEQKFNEEETPPSEPDLSEPSSEPPHEQGDAGDSGESGESDEDGEGDEGEEGEEGQGDTGKKGEGDDGEVGLGEGELAEEGEKQTFRLSPKGRASKVWQLREYADYDPDVELGTRNIKMALRRLRKFARTGAELELDLPNTIRSTARNGGLLDIIEVPERRNAVKVLLFLDVGGSMDEHISLCAQLFSAARSEFKYLEIFYFHNFLYESVWTDNERRTSDRISTFDLIRKFGRDYKFIFVSDANMARHEIAEKGGSVEHYNAEPGEVWLRRVQDHFKKVIWLNPVAEKHWPDSYSTQMIHRLMHEQMYHLSVTGIERAMRYLAR